MKRSKGFPLINLRDSLFKKYGTLFSSSFPEKGTLVLPDTFHFPLDDEQTTLFKDFFFQLKDDFRFHMLVDISCEYATKENSGHPILKYQLLNLEVHFRLQVNVELKKGPFFPSVAELWSSAHIFEADIKERFPLMTSDGSRSEQRQLLSELEGKKSGPLAEKIGPSHYKLPLNPSPAHFLRKWNQFGPYSSPLNGTVRLDLLMDEQKVYEAKFFKGFHFRDFEKKALNKDVYTLILWFERLCSRDSVFAPMLWVESMEKKFNIEIPDKAKALRMVWMELARVQGHLKFMGDLTYGSGFAVEASVFYELLEQVYHLFTIHTGKSQNFSLFTFGGMKAPHPLGWGTECLEAAKYIHKILEETEGELRRNPRWMAATRGFPMAAGKALDYGITGPNLRACGVNYDARKTKPTYFYEDVDFEVPLGIDGTTYDRFLVRFEELKQSLRIINQVLDHLPAGEVLNKDQPLYRGTFNQSNSEITPHGDWRDVTLQPEETYHTIEASEGELGLVFKVGEDHKFEHIHVRSPSLVHMGAYPQLVGGGSIQGALTAFQSLSIDGWEMDR